MSANQKVLATIFDDGLKPLKHPIQRPECVINAFKNHGFHHGDIPNPVGGATGVPYTCRSADRKFAFRDSVNTDKSIIATSGFTPTARLSENLQPKTSNLIPLFLAKQRLLHNRQRAFVLFVDFLSQFLLGLHNRQ